MLTFAYGPMNSGKSAQLLKDAFQYKRIGKPALLFTFDADGEAATGAVIASRMGLKEPAVGFNSATGFSALVRARLDAGPVGHVFIDEAQFLSAGQVWELARIGDELDVPVSCFGLRTNFRGEPFAGAVALMAISDALRELTAFCHCGRKAILNARHGPAGGVLLDGPELDTDKSKYEPVCRVHFRQMAKDPARR
ncbi:thymidine kinase [Maricaulaceae bacterium MS644]